MTNTNTDMREATLKDSTKTSCIEMGVIQPSICYLVVVGSMTWDPPNKWSSAQKIPSGHFYAGIESIGLPWARLFYVIEFQWILKLCFWKVVRNEETKMNIPNDHQIIFTGLENKSRRVGNESQIPRKSRSHAHLLFLYHSLLWLSFLEHMG